MSTSIISGLLFVASLAGPTAAACSRATLTAATDAYLAAQTAGQINGIKAIGTSNITYAENFQTIDIAKGLLSQPQKITNNRSTHDETGCATYTEVIVTDPAHPYVIGTQMRFSATDGKLVKIESIITDAGDWAFNATGTLSYVLNESWTPIPADKRDTRAVIQAAGDAYLDRFTNASVIVPYGTPCSRVEGGMFTGRSNPNNNTCLLGMPPIGGFNMTQRRYVIDETVGSVSVFLSFDNNSGGHPDSHEFRVEGGKIRYVHALIICPPGGPSDCGLTPPKAPTAGVSSSTAAALPRSTVAIL